ncbi:MAG: dihydropteroate synthase [Candidatus Omnitrophota bacterium]|nr:MAG: dihydropteroate synthase [Candidatus Omnitrophota bacterium]
MYIVHLDSAKDIKQVFKDLKVDTYGVDIMFPKSLPFLIKIGPIPRVAATILKQEMLSLGGDVALPRSALMGGHRKTDCLLMGNLSQLSRLHQKLKNQPFGLSRLAADLSQTISGYSDNNGTFFLGKYRLELSKRTHIMGVVNFTPDSFSGDGFYRDLLFREPQAALGKVQAMVDDGADIIDVGGESSRPGTISISVQEEIRRTIPVVKLLAKKIKVPISIDTCKPEVARRALDSGAHMVNDITGLRNSAMRKVVSSYNAAAVVMHMKGNPRTMQKSPSYDALIDEILAFLEGSLRLAEDARIAKEKIIIDPGIGFGKTLAQNLQILKRLKDFRSLGRPVLIGPSRKSFIGRLLNLEPEDRVFGTASACVAAVQRGASLVRVHDVKEVAQALKIVDSIMHA